MSELYKLPDGWEWKKLNDLAEVNIGKTPTRSKKEFFLGDKVWLSIRDLKGYSVSESKEMITDEAIKNSNIKIIKKGTLLMSFKLTLGRTAFADCDLYTNEAIASFPIKDKKVLDKYFLNYSIGVIDLEKEVDNAVKGKTLNKQKIKNLDIPLPSLLEQQRIVAKLDNLFEKIDKAIALHVKNMEEADAFMGSVLNDVFGELEEKYDKIDFNSVCSKITDGSHNPPKGIESSNYLMLSSKNIHNNSINFNNPRYLKEEDFFRENKRTDVSIGDVLLTIVGTIGRTAVVNINEKFTLQRSVAVLKPKKDLLDSYFLMYSLQKNLVILTDGAKGAAQKGIYLKSIKKLEIVSISLLEQQKTVTYLDKISLHVNKVKQLQKEKMENLKALKASILDKAFRGEL